MLEGPVYVHKHSSFENSVIVPNATAQDGALSWAARGLLLYMLSLPSNWRLNEPDLLGRSPKGRDHLRSTLRELEASGYLQRVQERDGQGRVSRSNWHVWDRPQTGQPSTENPSAERTKAPAQSLPQTGKPATASWFPAGAVGSEDFSAGQPSTENPSTYKRNIETNNLLEEPQVLETPPIPPSPGEGGSARSTELAAEPDPPPPPPPAAASPAPEPSAALPACALPHRQLAEAWWRERRVRHPAAPRALSPRDVTAMEHADACGVLPEFLKAAAANGWKSLHTGYRQRIAALVAPAATEGFEAFRTAYLACPRRATGQSIDRAIVEYGRALRSGATPALLLAALQSEIRDQATADRRGGFGACLPDMFRWLRDGRWRAYDAAQANPERRYQPPPQPDLPPSEVELYTPAQRLEMGRARRLAAEAARKAATAPPLVLL